MSGTRPCEGCTLASSPGLELLLTLPSDQDAGLQVDRYAIGTAALMVFRHFRPVFSTLIALFYPFGRGKEGEKKRRKKVELGRFHRAQQQQSRMNDGFPPAPENAAESLEISNCDCEPQLQLQPVGDSHSEYTRRRFCAAFDPSTPAKLERVVSADSQTILKGKVNNQTNKQKKGCSNKFNT